MSVKEIIKEGLEDHLDDDNEWLTHVAIDLGNISGYFDTRIKQNVYFNLKKRIDKLCGGKFKKQYSKHYFYNNMELVSFDNRTHYCYQYDSSKCDYFDIPLNKPSILRVKVEKKKNINNLLFPSFDKYPKIVEKNNIIYSYPPLEKNENNQIKLNLVKIGDMYNITLEMKYGKENCKKNLNSITRVIENIFR